MVAVLPMALAASKRLCEAEAALAVGAVVGNDMAMVFLLPTLALLSEAAEAETETEKYGHGGVAAVKAIEAKTETANRDGLSRPTCSCCACSCSSWAISNNSFCVGGVTPLAGACMLDSLQTGAMSMSQRMARAHCPLHAEHTSSCTDQSAIERALHQPPTQRSRSAGSKSCTITTDLALRTQNMRGMRTQQTPEQKGTPSVNRLKRSTACQYRIPHALALQIFLADRLLVTLLAHTPE